MAKNPEDPGAPARRAAIERAKHLGTDDTSSEQEGGENLLSSQDSPVLDKLRQRRRSRSGAGSTAWGIVAEDLSEVKAEVVGAANERLGDTIEAIKAFQVSVCEQANGHILQIDQLERVPLVTFDDVSKTVKPVDIDDLPLRDVVKKFRESIDAYREYTRIKVADAEATLATLRTMEGHQRQLVRALSEKN
jgi:hypothetical protein